MSKFKPGQKVVRVRNTDKNKYCPHIEMGEVVTCKGYSESNPEFIHLVEYPHGTNQMIMIWHQDDFAPLIETHTGFVEVTFEKVATTAPVSAN